MTLGFHVVCFHLPQDGNICIQYVYIQIQTVTVKFLTDELEVEGVVQILPMEFMIFPILCRF
jgi:hypothetical protein